MQAVVLDTGLLSSKSHSLIPQMQAVVLDTGLLSSKSHSLIPQIQAVLDAGLLSSKNHSLVPQIKAVVLDDGRVSSKNHFRLQVKCLVIPSKRCTSVHISTLAVACHCPLPTTARISRTQNVRMIPIEHTV
jgi:hypothetical protein